MRRLKGAVFASPYTVPKVALLRCVEKTQSIRGLYKPSVDVGKALSEDKDPVVQIASRRSRHWAA